MPNPDVNFPARFTPVSAVAFVKADGSTEVVTASTPLPVSSGALGSSTNHIGNVFVDDVADGLVVTGSVAALGVVLTSSLAGFGGGAFQVTSPGASSAMIFEQSNDGVNWVPLPVVAATSGSSAVITSVNAVGLYAFASSAAQVRARLTTYGSGTVTVVLVLKRKPLAVVGTSLAGSSAAIGSVTVSGTATVTGTVNTGAGYTDSVAALAGTATFTGTGRANTLSQYSLFLATAFADVAGTLFVDLSLDTGATYQPVASAVVAAGGSQQLAVNLTGAFTTATLYRVRYVNGAAAQTTFRLSSTFTVR